MSGNLISLISDRLQLFGMWMSVKYDRLRVQLGLIPAGRYAINPLLKYPRNLLCWCGSDKKSKSCCLNKQPGIITIEQAKFLVPYMKAVIDRENA